MAIRKGKRPWEFPFDPYWKEKQEQEKQERALKKEQWKKQLKLEEEAKWVGYQKLRKDIEAMPQYKIWRQAVLEKFGRKCAVCGSKNNLEVDHRYKSFYVIIKEANITNTNKS